MHRVVGLCFVLAACGKSSTKPHATSSGLENRPSATTLANLGHSREELALAEAVTKANLPTLPSGECRDSWHATMRGWMGMGYDETTLVCAQGKATLTTQSVGAHEEPGDPDAAHGTYALSSEQWKRVWELFDRAHWRELATDTCVADAPDTALDTDYMDIDIEISDGITTKSVKCGLKASSYHLMTLEAFQQALEIADASSVGAI